MLITVAAEVTSAGSPTSAADINSTRDRIGCSSYLGGFPLFMSPWVPCSGGVLVPVTFWLSPPDCGTSVGTAAFSPAGASRFSLVCGNHDVTVSAWSLAAGCGRMFNENGSRCQRSRHRQT
jgi:hypothetical protein